MAPAKKRQRVGQTQVREEQQEQRQHRESELPTPESKRPRIDHNQIDPAPSADGSPCAPVTASAPEEKEDKTVASGMPAAAVESRATSPPPDSSPLDRRQQQAGGRRQDAHRDSRRRGDSGRQGRGKREEVAPSGEGAGGDADKEKRLPKRKVALLVGYCGLGYSGSQMYVPFFPFALPPYPLLFLWVLRWQTKQQSRCQDRRRRHFQCPRKGRVHLGRQFYGCYKGAFLGGDASACRVFLFELPWDEPLLLFHVQCRSACSGPRGPTPASRQPSTSSHSN
jgi:hypothetical protein